MIDFSRRNWMATLAMAGVSSLAGRSVGGAPPHTGMLMGQAHGNESPLSPFARNVLKFGARGDAKTDNTTAFQKALDAVHAAGGGIVHVPAGRFLFKGHLTMPSNTALLGVFAGPPAGFFGKLGKGTVLMPTEGRGRPNGPAFISVRGVNCTIRGLGIYYPQQHADAVEPAPYPWTIQNISRPPTGHPPFGGDGSAGLSVIDVNLTNAYQGIDLTLARRHYIDRVFGRPILIGIYVDQCYDTGRIENTHFVWPFWRCGIPITRWIQDHGTAFRFGRSDGQYVFNTVALQYHIGYHFVQTPSGACYGNFLGMGADSTFEAIRVDAGQPDGGLLFTNGLFVAMVGAQAQGFVIGPKNTGQVIMNNCAFWGLSNRIGTIQGTGPVSLIGCNFQNWDKNNRGEPAILCDGAPATISNCLFFLSGTRKALAITRRCATAVITGNTFQGKAFVVDRPGPLPRSKFQIHSNVATGKDTSAYHRASA